MIFFEKNLNVLCDDLIFVEMLNLFVNNVKGHFVMMFVFSSCNKISVHVMVGQCNTCTVNSTDVLSLFFYNTIPSMFFSKTNVLSLFFYDTLPSMFFSKTLK